MSEEAQSDPKSYINISLTDEGVSYDTDLSLVEVVFWLETIKAEVITKVFENQ